MKRLLFVTFSCIFFIIVPFFGTDVLLAQEKEDYWKVDKNDPFNDVGVLLTDGLSMWIIRQKISLKGYEVLIKADAPANDGMTSPQGNTHIELYLPLIYNENFSSMVGVLHGTSRILTDVRNMDMGLIHDWYWLSGCYQIDNWKFLLNAEYYMNTNRNSLFSKPGDAFMPYLVSGYAFSDSWQLIGLCGYQRTSMVDKEKTTPVIGAQLRYQPTHTFKLIIGAPVLLGTEWAVSQHFQVGCQAKFTGKFSGEAFVTFYPNEKYYIGLHYYGNYNESESSYFNNETYQNGTEQVTYNNLTQIYHSLSLDLGFKVSGEMALILSSGYRLGDKIGLFNNTNHKLDIDGKNEIFISATVQYLNYFDK
jgi:hypothetical protein